MNCIICRYGELALKGKNRNLFENKLVQNMGDCLSKNQISAKIEKVRGRIFVFTSDKTATDHLKRVFGLVSLSPAVYVDNNIENIKQETLSYIQNIPEIKKTKTFRISARRPNKKFSKSSNEMEILLGTIVEKQFNLKVKLKKPDLDVGVEIHDRTFIFHKRVSCFGGLPLGISGKVISLIRNNDDITAAWLMMKRGCEIITVAKEDFDISKLKNCSYGSDVSLIKITELQDINRIAEKTRCKALAVGDRLKSFNPQKYKMINMEVLTPLIGTGTAP